MLNEGTCINHFFGIAAPNALIFQPSCGYIPARWSHNQSPWDSCSQSRPGFFHRFSGCTPLSSMSILLLFPCGLSPLHHIELIHIFFYFVYQFFFILRQYAFYLNYICRMCCVKNHRLLRFEIFQKRSYFC